MAYKALSPRKNFNSNVHIQNGHQNQWGQKKYNCIYNAKCRLVYPVVCAQLFLDRFDFVNVVIVKYGQMVDYAKQPNYRDSCFQAEWRKQITDFLETNLNERRIDIDGQTSVDTYKRIQDGNVAFDCDRDKHHYGHLVHRLLNVVVHLAAGQITVFLVNYFQQRRYNAEHGDENIGDAEIAD